MPKTAKKTLTYVEKTNTVDKKGAGCSKSGREYEVQIAKICRKVQSPYLETPLNTQDDSSLGGCGADVDITLNWKKEGDIGVEAKRPTPDWMQLKLKKEQGIWVGVKDPKIPAESKSVFEEIIGSANLFGGKTPTFFERSITYDEWTAIKKETPEFKDTYIDCPDSTIADLYRAKKCQYIQVDGKGLYHTGEDVCEFGVPLFRCKQRIRVRLKVHATKTAKGNASLSVTAAAQPTATKIPDLDKSPFSLDSFDKLPKNLVSPKFTTTTEPVDLLTEAMSKLNVRVSSPVTSTVEPVDLLTEAMSKLGAK